MATRVGLRGTTTSVFAGPIRAVTGAATHELNSCTFGARAPLGARQIDLLETFKGNALEQMDLDVSGGHNSAPSVLAPNDPHFFARAPKTKR